MDLLHMGRDEINTDAEEALNKLGNDRGKQHGRNAAEPGQESAQQRAQDEDPGRISS